MSYRRHVQGGGRGGLPRRRPLHQLRLLEAEGLRGVESLGSGVKVIFNLASGILMNQHSNINDTIRIPREPGKLDLLVVSDVVMSPSARFADLLLPGVSFFETENVVPPWSDSDYLLYNQQAIPPLFGSVFEYEWVRLAARYMGYEEQFLPGRDSIHNWVRELYEAHRLQEPELPDFDAFRQKGCFIYQNNPYRIAFQENIRDGVPFDTPSGKIEIFSPRLYQSSVPGIPCYTPCEEGVSDPLRRRYPLQLIGYHTKRRAHSIGDANPLLEPLDPPRPMDTPHGRRPARHFPWAAGRYLQRPGLRPYPRQDHGGYRHRRRRAQRGRLVHTRQKRAGHPGQHQRADHQPPFPPLKGQSPTHKSGPGPGRGR